ASRFKWSARCSASTLSARIVDHAPRLWEPLLLQATGRAAVWPSEQSSPTSPSDAGLTEKELRLLADAMPQLAWMARVDGSVAWFNRYWYAFTGATPQEPADAACRAAHHPEHVDRAAEGYHRA